MGTQYAYRGDVDLASFVRDVPDFPSAGVVFKDIGPLLADSGALSATLRAVADAARDLGAERIVGIDARGFLFGVAVADRLNLGFAPVRKAGKLPGQTMAVTYDLEYGTDTLEVAADAIGPGEQVVVIDDVLATGGTADAAFRLVEAAGGVVAGLIVVVELSFLDGRAKIGDRAVISLVDVRG